MAEGEHGFLGLTHNPFTEDGDAFFQGGDRQSRLDQLRHLTQWSRSVMLVTGPQGVGKTMLARRGRVFRLEPHLQRLGDSAEQLLLTKRLRLRDF